MKATEQTLQQAERALHKVIEKFPPSEEPNIISDIHLQVSQESGELRALDDDEREITRCVVEQWIENKEDSFYHDVASVLRTAINHLKEKIDTMSILKPFSFVLEDDNNETIAELYLVDDDIVIINEELMVNLDEDLDRFLENLLKE